MTHLCFKRSTTILIYVLFPGQKIFLSLYHPTESIEPRKISGDAGTFKANIAAKVTENLPELHHCKTVERKLFTIRDASKNYEIW